MSNPRYIHERPDWPAFRWDAAALSEELGAVRYRQGRLAGELRSLGVDLRNESRLDTLTSDVVMSSEIEGEALNPDDVRSSLARHLGIDAGALAPADRRVEGVVEMTLDAVRNYDAPLTQERLFSWHAALFPTGFSGLRRIAVGRWRTPDGDPMQVVSGPLGRERTHFEAPAAERIPGEMNDFLAWFNGNPREDAVLRAALAHLWFVTIHPFEDGNGRIARTIADMSLARAEGSPDRFYSVSMQIRKDRRQYYDVLERTQKGSLDVTLWLQWFLQCLERALTSAENTQRRVMTKAGFWQEWRNAGINDRQRRVLNLLLDGQFTGRLTSSRWGKVTGCSHDTALRDIQALIRMGILTRTDGGGRSTSYALSGRLNSA